MFSYRSFKIFILGKCRFLNESIRRKGFSHKIFLRTIKLFVQLVRKEIPNYSTTKC